jgi:perosamine synthetase
MKRFKKFNTIGKEELDIATKIIKTGKLSEYLAKEGKFFNGGYYVNKFEKSLQKYFKVNHAIVVNSWTSGLITIIGALGIKKGDEVILSPWTMSACAVAILHWGAVPVFCDIDKETFCIDPEEIKKKITKKTKAIMAIDIFGYPANINEIKNIINKKNIKIISDSAQSIGAKYNKKFAGTVSDIGGFSLNFHKHINTGEGGIIVTNNKKLSENCRMIRNHAEAVNNKKKISNNNYQIGFNFRLTELQAGIGLEQLKKLKLIVKKKQDNAEYLTNKLKKFKGLILPNMKNGITHAYYMYPMRLDTNIIKVEKKKFFELILKEKLPIADKYANISNLLVIKNRIMKNNVFKNIEQLNQKEYLGLKMWAYDFKKSDLDFIISKLEVIWKKLKI